MSVVLYGSPLSLYTGKPRSYFIKAGIDYRETAHTSDHYNQVVLPKAGNRRGIPTIELENQDVIRDGTAIIDHFEALNGGEFSPKSLKQNFVSRLLDVIGMEGLLRPAMHYRWNFPENETMLKFHFSRLVPAHMDRDAMSEQMMNAMRSAGQNFGAVPETFSTVEALYEELIEKLATHLGLYPYFLGHKPSIGDFGMMAPLYAHLGRDPAPLRLMQTKAVELLRWVERMNRPELDQGEFVEQGNDYLADDEIPTSLIDLLKLVAEDFMPETRACAVYANEWLGSQTDMAHGTTAERAIGLAEFEIRGQTIKAIVQPFRFYLLQRLSAIYDQASTGEQGEINELLKSINMADLMELRLSREIGRQDNLEVWL